MTQDSLFHDMYNNSDSSTDLLDGLQYQEGLLDEHDAEVLFNTITNETDWQQPSITIAGKQIPIPRLQSWQGDGQLTYRYSGQTFHSQPWHPSIRSLKALVEEKSNAKFNAVLCNLYRNEHDSVSWHADDEPELGSAPIIASVSLGATREFQIKRSNKQGNTMKIS